MIRGSLSFLTGSFSSSVCESPSSSQVWSSRLSVLSAPKLPLHNRYEALAAEDDLRHKIPQIYDNSESDNESEEPEHDSTRNQRKQRIPPITITRAIQDYSKTLAELINATPSKQVRVALVKEGLSVRVETREDYEALRKALDKGKVPYFTHLLKNQKPKS